MSTEKIKILLVEDDKNLGNLLKDYLVAKGYDTTLEVDGDKGIKSFLQNKYDMCVLDIMMPIKDGFTLAKEIRNTDKQVPIIFLTARSLKEDKLEGFRSGADDYITKPFTMEELSARIQAVLRRTAGGVQNTEKKHFDIGKYHFDYDHQLLKGPVGESKLTSKESELLKMLSDNINAVLERGIALNHIWKDDSYFNARSMDVYITKLRKYLKDDPTIEIVNVHGRGFKLTVG